MDKKKEKSLSVQAVFAIPKDPNYTDEYLNIILEDSVRKFQGMSTHLPDLPDEFALALVVYDEETTSAETTNIVWMTAEQESAYLPKLNKEIDFYNLEVVEVFSSGEFEEGITIINGKEVRTGNVTINKSCQN
jgi:hypothetical protein